MRHDLKIKRVISRYGLEGYGLYCLILESITESLSNESPMPELSETCEDIAEFYNGNTARINEIANFMMNQGLFDLSEVDGHIICHKVYKFLDTSATRSDKLRKMISDYKIATSQNVRDSAQTNLIEEEVEEEVEEEIEIEEEYKKERVPKAKRKIESEFEIFYSSYPKKIKKQEALRKWKQNKPPLDQCLKVIEDWKEIWAKDNNKYCPNPATWIHQGRWEDSPPERQIEQLKPDNFKGEVNFDF
jgi:hypothetical protein